MIRSKVLNRYALFYVSMALTACAVVGFLLLLLFSQELGRSAQEDIEQRASLAVSDFEAQEEQLTQTGFAVKANAYCQPQYIRGGYMREREAMSAIGRLQGHSVWHDQLYVWYPARDVIYSETAKYESHYFFHYKLETRDPDALRDQALDTQDIRWLVLDDNALLRVQPITFISVAGRTENAFVLSVVSNAQITKQVSFLTGLPSKMSFSGEQEEGWISVWGTDLFNVLVQKPAKWLERVRNLKKLSILLMVCTGVFFIFLALTLAYFTYRPIRKLTSHLAMDQGYGADEFKVLDKFIQNVLDERADSQKKMLEQVRSMEERRRVLFSLMLRLLLEGKAQPESNLLMKELGMSLPGPYYALILLSPVEEGEYRVVEEMMQELSDNGTLLYPVQMNESVLVLASLSERTMLAELIEMVRASCDASGLSIHVSSRGICDSLDGIHLLYTSKRPDEVKNTCYWYDDGSMDALLQALRLCHGNEAQGQIRAIADSIAGRCSSDGLRRCAYVDVFSKLLQFSLDENLPVPSELCDRAMTLSTREDFIEVMQHTVSIILSGRYVVTDRERLAHGIAEYIEQHACELSFNLAELSEKFSLSSKYATSLLREYTGLSYKEYVTRVRIQKACEILHQSEESISGIHELVGYSSASHFVKVFKQTTGMTPSAFRALGTTGIVSLNLKAEDDSLD